MVIRLNLLTCSWTHVSAQFFTGWIPSCHTSNSEGLKKNSAVYVINICNECVGQNPLTDKGDGAFIKVTMMLAVVMLHCHLQITACGVSFSYYGSSVRILLLFCSDLLFRL